MNKFRKIAIGALLAAGAGCLTVAAAGCSGPDYFKLTFEGKGLDYVFQGELAPESGEQFVSGYLVKSGVEVRFTLAVSENTEGTPVIMLNGDEISADEGGVYSFVIDKESVVSVSGLKQKKKITFSQDEYFMFLDENGDEITEAWVSEGGSLKFKAWVSPYMVSKYEKLNITNNYEVLELDDNGYYTISDVTEDSIVNIENLEQAESFLERGDGTGTEADPYRVRKPIDMFMVAALVNSDFYTGYSTAYYKLENDIDMQGEKLYVIGDMSNANAIFCGNFDGAGHKISNFYVTDEVVDQETYNQEYLSFVGVFGAASATTGGPAVIKNLTLEDYEIITHPKLANDADQSYQAGSFVAYGVGVQLDNCHAVDGSIIAQNDDKKTCNVGGLIGVLQSVYDDSGSSTLTYDAYVNGCSADVEITGSGVLYYAGGAVGLLSTADTQAIAYVSNTVTSGSVSGTIFVGGIVGDLTRFSAVANCYSSSAVKAKNTNNTVGMAELIKTANAGGIVGYAENDTVITGCYSANTAIAASSASNNKYASTDNICAKRQAALEEASDAAQGVVYNNLVKDESHTLEVLTSQLGWNEGEWDMTGATPVYTGSEKRTVTITVKNGGSTVGIYGREISSPSPIYDWYGGALEEYIETSSGRSWGYYFDEELTQRVPNGYIPLSDAVLYVGIADYSEAAGQYYLGKTNYGVNAYFTLEDDGSYSFRDGGMSYSGVYSYDGNKITLYYSCFGALQFTADQTNGSYATMVMEKDGDGYKLSGKIYIRQLTSAITGSYTNSLQELSMTASKKSDAIVYGEYTNSDDSVLVLKADGTGTYKVGKNVKAFTYIATEAGITTSIRLSITVAEDGRVTEFAGSAASLKDGFAGTWKTSAGSSIEYVFDGFGTVTCGGVTGTYEEVSAGSAIISLNGAEIDAAMDDDALYIDGVAYYLSDGFTGIWYGYSSASGESFELTLGGIGSEGYGEAEMTFYSGVTSTLSGQYSVSDDGVMTLYVGDTLYGELIYNKLKNVATGSFFSFKTYSERSEITYTTVEFKLYDLLKGVWECNVGGVKQINFTGKTAGDGSASAIVTYTNGRTAEAIYKLDTATAGSITINGTAYKMRLDENTSRVSLSIGSEEQGALALKDSWSGVTLYDGQTAYAFDGRGNLGGYVTLSDNTTLPYVIGADGLPVVDGKPLSVNEGRFSWNGKTLEFNTGFANTWLVPVTNEEIRISEVTANFAAIVTIDGNDYNFIYNPERNTLTFTSMNRKGELSVTTLSLKGGKELSLTSIGKYSGDVTCLASTELDTWLGTYTGEDGSWTFDGHGLGEYGIGTATFTDKNGKKTTYSYKQDKLGFACINMSTSVRALFVEVKEGGYKMDGGTVAYKPANVDAMYLTVVNINGSSEDVTLDGLGNTWNNSLEKKQYTYTYLTKLSGVTYLIVKDGENKYIGSITTVGGVNRLKLNDYVEWTLPAKTGDSETGDAETENKDKIYIFVGGETGNLWRVDGDNYVREYTYKPVKNTNNVFTLTDMDGKTFKMTLNEENHTFVLEENKGSNSNGN